MTGGGTGTFPGPMLAVMAAGAGKTNLIRFLAAQQLRHGWPVWFIDLQRQHRWARGLPGVRLVAHNRNSRGRPNRPRHRGHSPQRGHPGDT